MVASALASGDITWAHAVAMTPTLTDTRAETDPDTAGAVEAALTQLARTDTVDRLHTAVRHLRFCLFPDGELARAERDFDGRWLSITAGAGGLVHLHGLLDAEGGAIVRTALDAATPPPRPDDPRTRAQATADALVDLCSTTQRGDTLPASGGVRAHVMLTVDLDTLRREETRTGATERLSDLLYPEDATVSSATPAATDNADVMARRLLTGGAQVSWTGPVHPETARRIACDAQVTRLVLDPTGQPLHLGRTRRLVSKAQSLALAVRDRGCIVEGCHHPPQWCDVHHVDHWVDGGKTDIGVLALLCRFHHRHVHELGWTMVRSSDGRYVVRPPATPHGPGRQGSDEPQRYAASPSSPSTPGALAGPSTRTGPVPQTTASTAPRAVSRASDHGAGDPDLSGPGAPPCATPP
jgi:hypothetical protein